MGGNTSQAEGPYMWSQHTDFDKLHTLSLGKTYPEVANALAGIGQNDGLTALCYLELTMIGVHEEEEVTLTLTRPTRLCLGCCLLYHL